MLFKRLAEADILMGSLPAKLATEEEQLGLIKQLEQEHTAAGNRLARAQEEHRLAETRVSSAAQCLACSTELVNFSCAFDSDR